MHAISVRWVIMSATSMSSNSKMLLIISFWTSSITPFSWPTSTIMRISSSVTASSSALGSSPNKRTTAFVETERIFTNGKVTRLTNKRTGTTVNETFSGFCMAIFLGASSPSTNEKYEVIRVISTVETPLITPSGITFAIAVPASAFVSIVAKLCAAVAEVKKPASVTPI